MGARTLGLQALTRVLLATALLCGLFVGLLAAPARAGDEGPVRLTADDWALLPINALEQAELARDHADLVGRATVLAKRRQALVGHLARRPNPDDDAGRKLAAQIRALDEELAPALALAIDTLEDPVIDPPLLAHVRAAPEGPHRALRYAMGLVLRVEGVPEAPRALLAALLPRVEGALLSLEAQKRALGAQPETAARGASLARLDGELRRIESRWWRLVDYTVPEAARVELHRRLPTSHQQIETALQHAYAVPGLTASQGARLTAVLKEIESEAAPDQALTKRLEREARESQGLRVAADLRAARDRLVKLQRWAVDEAKRIFTPAQWAALEAIPPRVTLEDRRQTSPQVLAGTRLSPEQQGRLAAWRDALGPAREAFQAKRMQAGARMAGMSPDAPERAAAQMELAAVIADGNGIQRTFNGRCFLELLTVEQTTHWVLGLTGGNR